MTSTCDHDSQCPYCGGFDCPESITVTISPVVEATMCSYAACWQAAMDLEDEQDKIDPLVEWRAMMERETRPSRIPVRQSRSGGICSRFNTREKCRKRLYPKARAPPWRWPAASGGIWQVRIRWRAWIVKRMTRGFWMKPTNTSVKSHSTTTYGKRGRTSSPRRSSTAGTSGPSVSHGIPC